MSTTYLWYATRGAGAVSLLLLSAVMVLGVLSVARFGSPGWPRFVTTGLHRNLSLLAVVFLGLHIATAVIDPYTSLGWATAFIPFSSGYRTFWLGLGTVAFDLLLGVVLTSLLSGIIGRRAWRAVHWLAYASWPVAVSHGLGIGTDRGSVWLLVLSAVCIFAVGWSVAARLTLPSNDRLAAERTRFRQSAAGRSIGP